MSKSIDDEIINEIRGLQTEADPNALADLLTIFLRGIPEQVSKIGISIRDKNAANLRAETHCLKSSSANYGAIQVATLCKRLEKMGEEGVMAGTQELFTELQSEVDTVVRELENLPEMMAMKKRVA